MSKTAKDYILGLSERFDGAKHAGAETVFHFEIEGEGGGQFTAAINDGKCTTNEGFHGEAKCVVKSLDTTFVDILEGRTNPQMAVFGGKLKISNLGEMMKYAKSFGLM